MNIRNVPSLLIVGVPKGFTTQTYSICLQATGLKDSGAPQGEILNWDMWHIRPFLELFDKSEEGYNACKSFLKRFKKRHVIKDVVQPFHVYRYIQENPDDYNVLYVEREANSVYICQKLVGWGMSVETVQSLYRGKFTTIKCEEAMYDINPIFNALEKFYHIKRFNYITSEFIAKREETVKKLLY